MDMTNYWKNLNENQNDSEDSQEQPVGEPEETLEEDLVIDEIDTEFEEVDPGKDDPDLIVKKKLSPTIQFRRVLRFRKLMNQKLN